jgi:ethanolamine utilization protein EutN
VLWDIASNDRPAPSSLSMFLARVIGSVVATKKDAAMTGYKLLVLRPLVVDETTPDRFRPGANTVVAVDGLGAGIDEVVLFCQGSSARQASGMKSLPVDAVVIGIVDTVDVQRKKIYPPAT